MNTTLSHYLFQPAFRLGFAVFAIAVVALLYGLTRGEAGGAFRGANFY